MSFGISPKVSGAGAGRWNCASAQKLWHAGRKAGTAPDTEKGRHLLCQNYALCDFLRHCFRCSATPQSCACMQSQASFISTLVRITTKITSHEYSLTKKGVAFFNATPWKYLAERKRFELLVPFGYTRFPIVLLKPGSETSPQREIF